MFAALPLALALAQAPAGSTASQPTVPIAGMAGLSHEQIAQLKAKADSGDAAAQLALGKAYQDGNGLPQNEELAAQWYRKAADQGNPEAQNDLGLLYRTGRGVDQNKEEAVRWYRKAARQKYAKGMFNLATAYYNGDGVTIDDVAACAWFLLAQEAGMRQADEPLKRMATDLQSYQMQDAFLKIAGMYKEGQELPSDVTEVVKWYQTAADRGSVAADIALANMFLNGRGVARDYLEARRRCEAAAKTSPAAAFCLGFIYRNGLGVNKDPAESAKWFEHAAEMGHAPAMLNLGQMYENGEGVKQDHRTAYMWTYLASIADIPEAKQREETLRKEIGDKAADKERHKAMNWTNQHRPLVLVRR